jgi:hypothetical protein
VRRKLFDSFQESREDSPRLLDAAPGLEKEALSGVHFLSVPAPKKPDDRQFKVGDRVTVSLSGGRIVDATVTAVVEYTKSTRLQVSYGKDETALVYLWQVSAPKV